MKRSVIYISIVCIVYAVFIVVLNVLPRSTYSELEKRDLKTFPEYSGISLFSGEFTSGISSWFSDSEPFRDSFMMISMRVKDVLTSPFMKEESVRLTINTDNMGSEPVEAPLDVKEEPDTLCDVQAVTLGDGVMKVAHAGILVLGKAPHARALMTFHSSPTAGGQFAAAADAYKEAFGDSVEVYIMPIPIPIEFYVPLEAKKYTTSQKDVINHVFSVVSPKVKTVNVYSELAKHSDEDIYMRTDHHWAPLGAYYAAEKFAKVAGVPFRNLSAYEKHVVHNVVGSMFGYSHDIAINNSPEDFVYYIPNQVEYEANFTYYSLDSDFQVKSEGKPVVDDYFRKKKDGCRDAYCTFMGGDAMIVKVQTSTRNGRRLLVIKDSFGNALPGYMFYSFEQVHVTDFRYFKKNMVKYVKENGITDILMAHNTMNVVSYTIESTYKKFLTQPDGVFYSPKVKDASDSLGNIAETSPETTPSSPEEVNETPAAPAPVSSPADTSAAQ